MNKVQEKAAAVIHKNDLSDLEPVTQQALQAPVPDARASELRSRLLDILSKSRCRGGCAKSVAAETGGQTAAVGPEAHR